MRAILRKQFGPDVLDILGIPESQPKAGHRSRKPSYKYFQ